LYGKILRYIVFIATIAVVLHEGAITMNPGIARTLADQRREELTHDKAGSGRDRRPPGRPGWLSRHRWHVSWTQTILPSAGGLDTAAGRNPDRSARRGSSLVIIISAHR
jgi:hypothetical protein